MPAVSTAVVEEPLELKPPRDGRRQKGFRGHRCGALNRHYAL